MAADEGSHATPRAARLTMPSMVVTCDTSHPLRSPVKALASLNCARTQGGGTNPVQQIAACSPNTHVRAHTRDVMAPGGVRAQVYSRE